ncbi:toxin-antitoxin system, toxin component [Streptomyces chartreusis]
MTRSTERLQKGLLTVLSDAVARTVDPPAEPTVVFEALCQAMSDRRDGRPIKLIIRSFPEELANTHTGLWLDLEDHDLVIVEERLAPDHKLVVLGHELWHMHAGHCGHDLDGNAVAARAALTEHVDWETAWEMARSVAARAHSHTADELAAETFGLRVSKTLSPWLASPDNPRHLDDAVARRIGASLGYTGLQG